MDPFAHPMIKLALSRLDELLRQAPDDMLELVGDSIERERERRRNTVEGSSTPELGS